MLMYSRLISLSSIHVAVDSPSSDWASSISLIRLTAVFDSTCLTIYRPVFSAVIYAKDHHHDVISEYQGAYRDRTDRVRRIFVVR